MKTKKIDAYIKLRDDQFKMLLKNKNQPSTNNTLEELNFSKSVSADKFLTVRQKRNQFLKLSLSKIKKNPEFFKKNQDKIIEEILVALREIK